MSEKQASPSTLNESGHALQRKRWVLRRTMACIFLLGLIAGLGARELPSGAVASDGPQTVERRAESLIARVEMLEKQVAKLEGKSEALEKRLQGLSGRTLSVKSFDLTIAHKSKARAGDIPFDDQGVKDFPQALRFGKEVVATWILHTDHRGNNPIYASVGYLGVRPSGNQVIIGGSAGQNLAPTSFTVYVLYTE